MAACPLKAGADAGLAMKHDGHPFNPLVIAALLNHGVDLNAEENYGRCQIHFAYGRRHDKQQAQTLLNLEA